MKGIARVWIIFSLVVLSISMAFVFLTRNANAQVSNPPPPAPTSDAAIEEAVQLAVEQNKQSILGLQINNVEVNNIVYSNDGQTALVWLAQRDTTTGDIIGREPALAIARNTTGLLTQANDWQITFEFGTDFNAELKTLPSELVTDEITQRYPNGQAVQSLSTATFTGYKLPWSTALRIRLTGSVGHYLDYNSCSETSCRYAYDFWNPDPANRMFPLLASKGGVIQAFKESCGNGDTQCTNYLVLRDDSTSPTTYQLYYHLANNSVPDNYTIGTYIQQGQYIGNVDDTGYSSDHHLHFHVYATPASTGYYAWGNSVRIIFSDVPTNGGEPRTCAETVNHSALGTECSVGPDGKKLTADDNYFPSGNTGAFPPSGALNTPAPWTTLTDRMLNVSGPAADNLGIARVQVLVNYDGTWRTVANANQTDGAYSAAVDMCSAGIPDGPFTLAVRIWDIEGNWVDQYTGLRQIFKNAPCGSAGTVVPACAPAAGEVALYSEPVYTGTCKKFTAGKYNATALAPVGDNAVQSIQVGSSVRALLFERVDDLNLTVPQGRLETLAADDANLADNRIGARQASALWVLGSTDIANAGLLEPYLTFPGNRADSDNNANTAPNPPNPTSSDSLVLAWTGGKGATYFTGTLAKGGVTLKTMSEQKAQSWSVGSLDPGTYTWTIIACNGLTSCAGALTNSTSLTFTVDDAALPTVQAVSTPTQRFEFESSGEGWTASGLWRWGDANRLQPDLTTTPTKAWIFNNTSSISDATYRAGDLTSPPITISAGGAYFLRFKFFSGVEGPVYAAQTFAGAYWDQRRVQVSVNGGAFADISAGQLVDDTQNKNAFWPDTALALGSFTAGQTIRVRFHFNAIDGTNNDVYGWAIDDVSVSNVPFDPGCKDNNDTPARATPIALGASADNSICPVGDVDVFSFSAAGGTPVRIDLDAKSLNDLSPLDSFITLLDSSGRDVLAANDDESSNPEPRYRDSLIESVLPTTGTYYVRVKAWDHPGAGGPAYAYRLSVSQNTSNIPRPTISMLKPANPKMLPIVPFVVQAGAADPNGSGVKRVDFYWHSSDWDNGNWTKFASDSNGSDGWWGIFTPPGDTTGSAFYLMATNNAGGSSGVLTTDMAPDLVTPTSDMNPLPASVNSTAVLLSWNAADQQNDLQGFDIQYRFNNAAWADWGTKPPGTARSAWFIGQPGAYQFRIRAVDTSGNQEAFPANAEAAATLNAACANDASEPANNAPTGAAILAPKELRELVFCQNDTDWVSFQAEQGKEYLLLFTSASGGAAPQARLYDPSGATVLAQGKAPGAGQGFALRWTAPATAVYRLEIFSANAAIYGSDVRYRVYAGPGSWYFMPLIGR